MSVEFVRADLVDPPEPWTLRKTDIMSGQNEAGSPAFKWIGLRILPPEAFDFLSPKKPSTEQKNTETQKEDSHV